MTFEDWYNRNWRFVSQDDAARSAWSAALTQFQSYAPCPIDRSQKPPKGQFVLWRVLTTSLWDCAASYGEWPDDEQWTHWSPMPPVPKEEWETVADNAVQRQHTLSDSEEEVLRMGVKIGWTAAKGGEE